jgi:hypothetical protein
MNLDKYSTKESLEELIQKKDEFLDLINESKGFILENLKTYNIKPDLDMLVDNLSVFTIQYITDNYKLNSEQMEKVTKFLSDEETIYNKKITEQEIEDHLINKKPLPYNTNLSLEQINKYYKEIEEQFELDESNMESILNSSFQKFSIEDAYKLERKFLLKNAFVLNVKAQFFNDEKYREFYKEIVLKAYKKPTIREFRNYVFTSNDKEFLIKLLKNTELRSWSDDYSDFTRIPGFTSLINKYEFFEQFNRGSIEHFSDAEVENNIDLFKRIYLEDNEDRSHYQAFDNFFRKKMSLKKFKAIFDEEFIEKFISNITEDDDISKFFGYNDAEYDKTVIDKQAHLSRIVAGLFAEDRMLANGKRMTEIARISDILGFRDDIERARNSPHDANATLLDKEKLEEHYHTIFNNIIPQYLTNDKLRILTSHVKDIFDPLTISLAEEYFKNNVNVNNFFVLASIYNENKDKYFHDYNKRTFMEKLNEYVVTMHNALIERNNSDELISVRAILNNLKTNEKKEEDKFIKTLLKNTPKHKGFKTSNDYNFLAFETNGLQNIVMWEEIAELRPALLSFILKNNFIPPESFIKYCLYNIESGSYTDFLKDFAKKNREYIEGNENLLSSYLASSKQEEIFPQNNRDSLETYFNDALELIKRINTTDINQEVVRALYPRDDMPYSFDDGNYPQIDIESFDENVEISKDLSKKEAKTLYLHLYKKEHLLKEKLQVKANLISYGFITEKLQKHLENKDFATVFNIKEARIKYNHEPFVNYVNNADFNELKNHLNDDAFFKLLKGSLSYEKNSDIKFAKFSYEQNMELAIILHDKYKEKNDSDEYRYSYDFLYFFAEENRDFVKEFVIEYFPSSMFYGYDLRPEVNYHKQRLIKGTYTNEDLYKGFLNLEKGDGFLSYRDVNADYKNLFGSVFFPERRNNKENQTDDRYKSFLDFIKDKSPMLYLLVANPEIFSPVLDYGRSFRNEAPSKYRSKDEAEHHYFLQTFDMDTLLKGLEVVIDKMVNPKLDKYGQYLINKKLASYAITRMVMQTSYELYDRSGGMNNTYESCLSDENTLRIMKLLFEKSPIHFIERRRIGQAIDTIGYFKAYIDEFYNFDNIKNFILPSSELYCDYFELEDRYGNTSTSRIRLLDFTKIIIETAVERKDDKVIDFMNHAISQHKFFKKEMKHNHHSAAYHGINDEIINAISKDPNINAMLSNAKLKMDLDRSLEVNVPVRRKNKL